MWDDGSTAARAAACSACLSSPAATPVRPATLSPLDSISIPHVDFDFRFQRFDIRRRGGGGDAMKFHFALSLFISKWYTDIMN